jgi:peptidoglycan hydrolase CwlO-like protein
MENDEYTMKKFIIFILVLFGFGLSGAFVYAQTTQNTTNNDQQVSELNNRIRELERKVSDLKSQGTSLSSQIAAMDNQIQLTEYRNDGYYT